MNQTRKKSQSLLKNNEVKEKKKKKNSHVIKVIGILLIILVVVEIVGVFTFLFLRYRGKQKIYETSASSGPVMPINEAKTELDNTMEWQDNWIRYHNKIYAYNEDIITFLVLGIDKQEEVKQSSDYQNGGQADAIFLVACDPNQGNVSVIAVNRNTMTPIEMYYKDGTYEKTMTAQLTLQHAYGDGMEQSCERMKNAVSKLFYQLPIHGYCSINMGAIPILNDDIGGVEVKVLEDINTGNITLSEGQNVLLKGDMAYWYLRDRQMDEFNSAGKRLERQKQYITAFMKTLLQKAQQSPASIVKVYQDVKPYTVTDLSVDEISYFASLSSTFDFGGYQIYSLDGETSMGERYEEFHADEQALYDLILKIFYQEVKYPEYGY